MKADKLTLAQKKAANVWDHVDDALAVIEMARAGKWNWTGNSNCKYVELRIDMRDGGCLIKDREGKRINPTDLRKQSNDYGQGDPWPTEPMPLGDWQQSVAKRVASEAASVDLAEAPEPDETKHPVSPGGKTP